jgi:peroxiredoxin
MKYIIILTTCFLSATISFGQSLVKIGDKAPKFYFNKVVNSPENNLDISDLKGKPAILAFWGTWCAPCIPEMINLAKLQKKYGDKIQIIGVSDDSEQKLKNFLSKRPSKIWFASDPSNNLWNIFDIQTAGHAVLIDKNNKVAAITETEKIDSTVINNLISSNLTNLSENRGTKRLAENQEPVKLDSNTLYSFVLQPQLKGITPMMKRPRIGPFAGRRITIINLVPTVILSEAFAISSDKRIVYASKEDSILSNQTPVCIDFIVSESDKSNLNLLFKNEVNRRLPVKGSIEQKIIPCLVLRPIKGQQVSVEKSSSNENKFSFNGLEFEGEGIPMTTFVNYLENELYYPVYDETGLTGFYNIKFSKNNVEPLKSIRENLAKFGLELVKDQKVMKALVISRQ